MRDFLRRYRDTIRITTFAVLLLLCLLFLMALDIKFKRDASPDVTLRAPDGDKYTEWTTPKGMVCVFMDYEDLLDCEFPPE